LWTVASSRRANISYSEFVEAFLSLVNSVARKAEGLRSYLSRVRAEAG